LGTSGSCGLLDQPDLGLYLIVARRQARIDLLELGELVVAQVERAGVVDEVADERPGRGGERRDLAILGSDRRRFAVVAGRSTISRATEHSA